MSYSIPPERKEFPVTPEFQPTEKTVEFFRDVESMSYVGAYQASESKRQDIDYGYLERKIVLNMKGGGTVTLTDNQSVIVDTDDYDPSPYNFTSEATGSKEFMTQESEVFQVDIKGYEKGIGGAIANNTSGNIIDNSWEVEFATGDSNKADEIMEVADELKDFFAKVSDQREHVMRIADADGVVNKTYHNISLDEVAKSVSNYLQNNKGSEHEFVLSVNENGLVESTKKSDNKLVIAEIRAGEFDGVDLSDSAQVIERMRLKGLGVYGKENETPSILPVRLPLDTQVFTTEDSQRNTVASALTHKVGWGKEIIELSSTENSMRNKFDVDAAKYKTVASVEELQDALFNQQYSGRNIIAVLSGEHDTPENKELMTSVIANKAKNNHLPAMSVVSNKDLGLTNPSYDFYEASADSKMQIAKEVLAKLADEQENTNRNRIRP